MSASHSWKTAISAVRSLSEIMRASGPISASMRALSSLVDFSAPVATTVMPRSSMAERSDQDQHALAGKTLPHGRERGFDPLLLARSQRFRAGGRLGASGLRLLVLRTGRLVHKYS
jgi:hypothetical protein